MKSVSGIIFGILGMALVIGGAVAGQSTGSTAQERDDDVRVMTYNIRHGQGNDDCSDAATPDATPEGSEPASLELDGTPESTPSAAQCNVDLVRTTDVIASLEPDIVALQEVDRFWDRSGGIDQPTELVESLDINACFGANLTHEPDAHADVPHQYGTLILSKYPILSCDNTFLANRKGWEQRGLLEVRVEIDGIGEVAVLNTHLQNDREGSGDEAVRLRTEQAEAIAERIADLEVPVILMGDFNAEPDDEELGSLQDQKVGPSDGGFATLKDEDSSTLQDAWQVAGDADADGYTYPASPDEDAERRVDYILASSDFEVVSVEVPVAEDTLAASDHLPVVADLAATEPVATTPSADEEPVTEPDLIVAPTVEPEVQPTVEPEPTAVVTEEPEPTEEPTAVETVEPEPTAQPTEEPTAVVTEEPEAEPTEEPPAPPAVEPPDEPEVVPPAVELPDAPDVVPPAVEPPDAPDIVPPGDD